MKLSKKTIEAFERIGSILRTEDDAIDEQALDTAIESFCKDKEVVEDAAELLLQLGEKPEVGIGFNVILGFVASAALGEDEDGTISDRVENLVGSAMFAMAKEILESEKGETKEDEPV